MEKRPETFEEFCTTITKVVEVPFLKMGELPPTWFLQKKSGEVGIFCTPWGDTDEKDSVNDQMKSLMERNEIVRYALVTESWLVTLPSPPEGTTIKSYRGPRPSQHPDRKEVIIVVGGDREGNSVEGSADIIRDDGGKATLGEFKLEFNKYTMQGRFVNLLRRIH
jgi:hypothetical protein